MPRPNGVIRKRQIDTLKIFNDNVIELQPNEQYSIGFTAAGRTFQLDVHLSEQFPSEPPHIVLSPLLQHPWVQLVTGIVQLAPGLVNFTVHSDLGRVVDAIVREFQRSVTKAAATEIAASTATETTPPKPTSTSVPTSTTSPTIASIPDIPPSTIQFPLPDLTALTIDELRQLNDDDASLNDFVDELDAMRPLDAQLDQLLADIESQTADNLGKESLHSELRQSAAKHVSTFRECGAAYDQSQQRYQTLADQFAPAHIRQLLQIAGSAAETECEAHVDEFLRKRIDAGAFLERYIPARVMGTMRKAKEDRLTQQLNALERAATF